MMVSRKIAALMVVTAMPAAAAHADEAADRVLAPLAACRALPDPAQRGLCYDRAYDGVRARLAAGDVVISDAAHRQAEFGLPSMTARRPGAAKAAAPVPIGINEIDSTVVAMRPYGVDMFTVQLADGGVWRTVDADAGPPLRPGTKVHLKKVLLGGILLQAEHGRGFKVIRVR